MGFPEDYLVFCRQCGQRGCICDDAAPRRSVMPAHLPALDPDFLAALERVPEEAGKEKES